MTEPEHDYRAGDCEAPEARTVFPNLRRSCPACSVERALDDDADSYLDRCRD